jgi:hypothetical protein
MTLTQEEGRRLHVLTLLDFRYCRGADPDDVPDPASSASGQLTCSLRKRVTVA